MSFFFLTFVLAEEWIEFMDVHLTERNEFLSKERDDVFKIKEKKDSWMGDFEDNDDLMKELNGGSLVNPIKFSIFFNFFS